MTRPVRGNPCGASVGANVFAIGVSFASGDGTCGLFEVKERIRCVSKASRGGALVELSLMFFDILIELREVKVKMGGNGGERNGGGKKKRGIEGQKLRHYALTALFPNSYASSHSLN